ncbi:hypothetical protein RDI58_020130 [Solanum bulbocastanum]|uniref:Uncharacterized protein n=1 Tax=Solanum bulbocastanum TaxID=147425 RepID=A0AAN8Y7K6_SOLBU
MNVGPSGFNNAPVTRALVIACTIFTIIFGVRGSGNQLGWSYQVVLLSPVSLGFGSFLVGIVFCRRNGKRRRWSRRNEQERWRKKGPTNS